MILSALALFLPAANVSLETAWTQSEKVNGFQPAHIKCDQECTVAHRILKNDDLSLWWANIV